MAGYAFGAHRLHPGQIFYATRFTLASVNIRPVLPGHCILVTRRVVPRYAQLSADEISDLWLAAQRVGAALEAYHGSCALTLTLQDGEAAGQSVPHVHVHVIPRRQGDLVHNDAIYDMIDNSERSMAHFSGEVGVKGGSAAPDPVASHRMPSQSASTWADAEVRDATRTPRTLDDMAAEALIYRKLLAGTQERNIDPF